MNTSAGSGVPKKYCEVAFPIPVHRQFTYEVPSELLSALEVGVRVVAPFRKRYITGAVVGISSETEFPDTKPIYDIVDREQIYSAEILHLTRWISDYYLSSWGESLKAAAPAGTSIQSAQLITLLKSNFSDKNNASNRILSAFGSKKTLTLKELGRKIGTKSLRYQLSKMEEEGLVEIAERFTTARATVQYESYVQFTEEYTNPARISAALNELDRRAMKQSEILLKLSELTRTTDGGVSVPRLLSQAKGSLSSLKALEEKGIVKFYDKESYRMPEFSYNEPDKIFELTAQQRKITGEITGAVNSGSYCTFLLHGVTGSGKTQVYIEAVDYVVKRGRGAIVLVPEISLTPQIIGRFRKRFGGAIAVLHSRMSLGERYDSWRRIEREEARIVIGARSAVFAPLKNLGLIVVDEEHESSYKQSDTSPRYNARDVAVMRCSINNAVAVLGSATPSVESYFNASTAKYRLLNLPERIDNAKLPRIEIVDMRKKRKEKSVVGSFSIDLKRRIDDRLCKKEGIIILRNRRGFSTYLQCDDCGATEMCPNCDVALTYHKKKKHLRCHYCGFIKEPPVRCAKCASDNLIYGGTGTQKVEEEILNLFPEAKTSRMDSDTTSYRGAHDRILSEFGNGDTDILVGTQLVAKGLDFPRVTLVGVVSADATMLMPDFRSNEKTFQLLTQVAGRAGRQDKEGEVLIQVSYSENDVLSAVANHDYEGFYNKEIEIRRQLSYPPFSRMVVIELRGKDLKETSDASELAARRIRRELSVISVLGPAPAVIGRLLGKFRFQIVIKLNKILDRSSERLKLILDELDLDLKRKYGHSISVIPDVDPVTTI